MGRNRTLERLELMLDTHDDPEQLREAVTTLSQMVNNSMPRSELHARARTLRGVAMRRLGYGDAGGTLHATPRGPRHGLAYYRERLRVLSHDLLEDHGESEDAARAAKYLERALGAIDTPAEVKN